MLKSELIERIAEQNPHLYQRDVEAIVNAILNTITTALARGDRVELRDFGVFTVKRRNARTGRNPRNGERVAVSEKRVPAFKPSQGMHGRLNPTEGVRAPDPGASGSRRGVLLTVLPASLGQYSCEHRSGTWTVFALG